MRSTGPLGTPRERFRNAPWWMLGDVELLADWWRLHRVAWLGVQRSRQANHDTQTDEPVSLGALHGGQADVDVNAELASLERTPDHAQEREEGGGSTIGAHDPAFPDPRHVR